MAPGFSGTESLLRAMESAGVARVVFSGSAAVYGTPREELVTEGTPTAPESPYGESKLAAELLIRGQVHATAETEEPLAAASLRYFNVAGSADPTVFDVSPYNVLPQVFTGLVEGRAPVINGEDFDTPDGTCVRDYIDVGDVALAHAAAARAFAAGRAGAGLQPRFGRGNERARTHRRRPRGDRDEARADRGATPRRRPRADRRGRNPRGSRPRLGDATLRA